VCHSDLPDARGPDPDGRAEPDQLLKSASDG
jgi:hypothetical protein